ncbi:hypothetical protein [uncultured Maricaulis sp.]|uniref:hypothetical protein n=1 Tax=uncultured Maricaulis sp. TaxID=174710 RepID=UPI0030D8C236|tara:strand:+ start:49739 stop:50296 length:558 start_codon:yes stop_codon:yes gene_type:complete
MFWLVWQIGFLILAAFGFGILTGWKVWSGQARSAETDKALADIIALRRENDNLARRLGEAEARATAANRVPAAAVKTGHADMPEDKVQPVAAKPVAKAKAKPAEAKPVVAPKSPAPVDAVVEDDLTAIKGLGPKAATSLKQAGVTRISQIAAWGETEIASWDDRINGRGRIVRDDWVGQARKLTA